MRAVPVVALGFCLLVSVPVGAAEGVLTASHATARGDAVVQAWLAGAVWSNQTKQHPLASLGFDVLDGALQVDASEWNLQVGGAGVTPAENREMRRPLNNSTLTGFTLAADARVLVLPWQGLPRAAADVSDLSLSPSLLGAVTYPARVDQDHPELRMDGAHAVVVAAEGEHVLRVEAPFMVALWGANFTIHGPEGDTFVSTGESDESFEGGPVPPALAGRHVTREAYVRVERGTGTLPLSAGFDVYVLEADLQMQDGALTVEGPGGTLPVDGSLVPDDSLKLVLDAPFRTTLSSADGRVGLAFVEAPQQAVLDGVTIRSHHGPPAWLWPLALLAVVAVPLLGRALSQRRLHRRLRHLDGLVRAKRFEAAVAVAQAIRRRRPAQEQALVAEAIGLLQARAYAAAQAVLEEPRWPAALQPMRGYLHAHALAGQHRTAEATAALEACLRDHPGLRRDAEANPLLSPLLARDRRPGGRHAVPGAP